MLSASRWAVSGSKGPRRGTNDVWMFCRDMFGACLRQEGMTDLVCREVAGAAARAPALSFLAAVARDHGATPQAVQLFRFPAQPHSLPVGHHSPRLILQCLRMVAGTGPHGSVRVCAPGCHVPFAGAGKQWLQLLARQGMF